MSEQDYKKKGVGKLGVIIIIIVIIFEDRRNTRARKQKVNLCFFWHGKTRKKENICALLLLLPSRY